MIISVVITTAGPQLTKAANQSSGFRKMLLSSCIAPFSAKIVNANDLEVVPQLSQMGTAPPIFPACEPCIPTRGTTVPTGNDWIHEIKHDGYRLIVQRDGQRVRLFTRNGHDWSGRFPLIAEAALRNRNSSFVIDGEAVLLGVDGISDFNGLHSRKHDDEVMFYAFDILVSDGEDLRKLPLHLRKNNLARLLARRINGNGARPDSARVRGAF